MKFLNLSLIFFSRLYRRHFNQKRRGRDKKKVNTIFTFSLIKIFNGDLKRGEEGKTKSKKVRFKRME